MSDVAGIYDESYPPSLWEEEPEEEPGGLFTPVGVTIPGVQAYIEGLGDPTDPAVQAETQRVLDLERAGQARSTLISWLDQRLGIEVAGDNPA